MYNFTLSQLKDMKGKGNYAVLTAEIIPDAETPISMYHKLCDGGAHGGAPYSFLFESAEQDARMGRYSFIGFDPIKVIQFDAFEGNPLLEIKNAMAGIKLASEKAGGRFEGGFVGYFAYEAMRHFEKIPMPKKPSQSGIPESVFFFPRIVIIFDHIKRIAHLNYFM